MYCILWVIFEILAIVVESGGSSGSNEALAKNNGGAVAEAAVNAANNGIPLLGDPIVARLVHHGGSLLIQPLGNPVDKPLLQQLIPISALQQGVNIVLGQAVGANGNLQGQLAQQAGGGPVTLFAVLPQNNAGIDPRLAVLTPGQMQLISVAGLNNQQQLVGDDGKLKGRLRLQRSLAARLRRRQSALMKAADSEEEEESSGMEMEETQLAPKNVS